jgi:hypothetical protein
MSNSGIIITRDLDEPEVRTGPGWGMVCTTQLRFCVSGALSFKSVLVISCSEKSGIEICNGKGAHTDSLNSRTHRL